MSAVLASRQACGVTGHASATALDASSLQRELYERISPEEVSAAAAEDPERARRLLGRVLERALAERGLPPASHDSSALISRVIADTVGFGVIDELMRDPEVSEVMVNGSTSIYFERKGRIHRYPKQFKDDEAIRTVIDRLVAPAGRRVDERSPLVSARVSGGHRAHAAIPPVSVDGPVLTVRKFTRDAYSLADLVSQGSLSQGIAVLLSWAVRSRMNIAVSGGTGSGKTTLLNALAGEIDPGERIITIEDSAELKFDRHPHVVRLEARPTSVDGTGEVTIRDLVVASLRMRPDRIVVGEVRAAEALDMLQAMNTGHDGSLTTLHANSPQEVPSRLATMVAYGGQMTRDQVYDQVASALDLVVHVARFRDGARRVIELCEVGRDTAGGLKLNTVCRFRSVGNTGNPSAKDGSWEVSPLCSIPSRAVDTAVATAQEVSRWEGLP